MAKRMSNDERLVRSVSTAKLELCLRLWDQMTPQERKAFAAKSPKARPGMALIRKELARRSTETGLEIMTALINGEER
jgi:hypothetical protein